MRTSCSRHLLGALAALLATACQAGVGPGGEGGTYRDAGREDAAAPARDAALDTGTGELDASGALPDAGAADASRLDAGPPPPPPDPPRSIYGIFGWSRGAGPALLADKRGWSVEFLRTEVELRDAGWWAARMSDYGEMIREGFTPITRISYGAPGMMPAEASRCDGVGGDDFAVRAAELAVALRDRYGDEVRRLIIGNEPNHPAEGALPIDRYVSCYLAVYRAIKAAWPRAIVMPATVAPWAPRDYACGGDAACASLAQPWERYYFGLVAGVGAEADAYDMHTYGGRGGDRDPYDDGDFGFGAFERALEVMDLAYPNAKPVYITEFNHGAEGPAYAYDGSWTGFVQRAFARIDDFNAGAGRGRIRALCWFTYDLDGWAHYNLSANARAREDFLATTTSTDYRAP